MPLFVISSVLLLRLYFFDLLFFFCKQKTAYDVRISDWSSDVCSSDLIVDDVMTAGTAVRESLALIRAQGATPAGVLIALDRQERGQRSEEHTSELQSLMRHS